MCSFFNFDTNTEIVIKNSTLNSASFNIFVICILYFVTVVYKNMLKCIVFMLTVTLGKQYNEFGVHIESL